MPVIEPKKITASKMLAQRLISRLSVSSTRTAVTLSTPACLGTAGTRDASLAHPLVAAPLETQKPMHLY